MTWFCPGAICPAPKFDQFTIQPFYQNHDFYFSEIYRKKSLKRYSWPNLVVPYTEELISRPFVDENWFRLMLQNRMSAKNAIGYIFFHSHILLFHLPQSATVSSAQWVVSDGFVPKWPKSFSPLCLFNNYSWPNLVVPYTEELISRPFAGENIFTNTLQGIFAVHL